MKFLHFHINKPCVLTTALLAGQYSQFVSRQFYFVFKNAIALDAFCVESKIMMFKNCRRKIGVKCHIACSFMNHFWRQLACIIDFTITEWFSAFGALCNERQVVNKALGVLNSFLPKSGDDVFWHDTLVINFLKLKKLLSHV